MLHNPIPKGVMQMMEAEQKISISKGLSAPEKCHAPNLFYTFSRLNFYMGYVPAGGISTAKRN